MALIACRECGREVSDRAAACPHCGCPVTAGPPVPPPVPPPAAATVPKKKAGCGTLLVAVFTLVAVGSCFTALRNPGKAPTPTKPIAQVASQTPEEQAAQRERQLAFVKDAANPVEQRLSTARMLAAGPSEAAETAEAREAIAELEEALRKQSIGKQWRYHSSDDAMSGKSSRSASVESSNQFEFGFPYQGRQRATLTIRRHPRWGNDVIFRIERGQVLCSSYHNCRVNVRFDDGPPRRLSGNEPSDNSTETVFIPGYKDFVARLSRAKTVRVEVDIYQEGPLVAEFDVEGFDAARLQ